ncbi:MAG: aldehyde dehydrogenase family protein [Planctomycetota bacterium]
MLVLPDSEPCAPAAPVRGAFEYQGQKCSAASRAYVPKSLWNDVKARMAAMLEDIRMGDIADFGNFMGAVIDAKAFARQRRHRRPRRTTPPSCSAAPATTKPATGTSPPSSRSLTRATT